VGVLAFGGVLALLGAGIAEFGERGQPLGRVLSATAEFFETNCWP
jgi:hypothetical protein